MKLEHVVLVTKFPLSEPRFFSADSLRRVASLDRARLRTCQREVKERMKRIISACLEQTQTFETEHDYDVYIRGLERKGSRYKIVSKEVQENGSVIAKVIREYNAYPIGNYLD